MSSPDWPAQAAVQSFRDEVLAAWNTKNSTTPIGPDTQIEDVIQFIFPLGEINLTYFAEFICEKCKREHQGVNVYETPFFDIDYPPQVDNEPGDHVPEVSFEIIPRVTLEWFYLIMQAAESAVLAENDDIRCGQCSG